MRRGRILPRSLVYSVRSLHHVLVINVLNLIYAESADLPARLAATRTAHAAIASIFRHCCLLLLAQEWGRPLRTASSSSSTSVKPPGALPLPAPGLPAGGTGGRGASSRGRGASPREPTEFNAVDHDLRNIALRTVLRIIGTGLNAAFYGDLANPWSDNGPQSPPF